MRRTFFLQILIILFADATLAAPKPIRLTLQLPPESLLYQNLRLFKDRVAELSHGSLNIQLFPSSELYKAEEVPKAVGSGQIEMGASLLLQYAEIVPATDIFAVPFLFSDPGLFEAAMFSGSGVRGPLDETIRQATGARVLWWVPNGAEAMGSKGLALRTPASISGKRIRVAGLTLAEFIKHCGGTGIIIPGSEQYAALERGEVDALSTSIESFVSRRLWKLVDRVTLIRHARQAFIILINEQFWQSMSTDQRRILAKVALEAEQSAQHQDVIIDRRSIDTLSRLGIEISEATAVELDEWKSCSSPVSELYLTKSGHTGEQVMSAYRKLLLDLAKRSSRMSR